MTEQAALAENALEASGRSVRCLAGMQQMLVRSGQRSKRTRGHTSLAVAADKEMWQFEKALDGQSCGSAAVSEAHSLLLLTLWIGEVYGVASPRLTNAGYKAPERAELETAKSSILDDMNAVSANLHHYERGLFESRIESIQPLSELLPKLQSEISAFLATYCPLFQQLD